MCVTDYEHSQKRKAIDFSSLESTQKKQKTENIACFETTFHGSEGQLIAHLASFLNTNQILSLARLTKQTRKDLIHQHFFQLKTLARDDMHSEWCTDEKCADFELCLQKVRSYTKDKIQSKSIYSLGTFLFATRQRLLLQSLSSTEETRDIRGLYMKQSDFSIDVTLIQNDPLLYHRIDWASAGYVLIPLSMKRSWKGTYYTCACAPFSMLAKNPVLAMLRDQHGPKPELPHIESYRGMPFLDLDITTKDVHRNGWAISMRVLVTDKSCFGRHTPWMPKHREALDKIAHKRNRKMRHSICSDLEPQYCPRVEQFITAYKNTYDHEDRVPAMFSVMEQVISANEERHRTLSKIVQSHTHKRDNQKMQQSNRDILYNG